MVEVICQLYEDDEPFLKLNSHVVDDFSVSFGVLQVIAWLNCDPDDRTTS